jgi:pimeloyl-ACP methyl ester carboxylesterase
VPYAIAHLVDWGNDLLVERLLRGTQAAPDGGEIARYLSEPPEPLFPAPHQLPSFSPAPAAKQRVPRGSPLADEGGRVRAIGRRAGWLSGEEIWEGDCPWHGAEGRNARWVASRVPAKLPSRAGCAPVGTAPAVILLHGWLAVRMHMGHYLRLAWWLARHGVDVWLPRLPFHLERTPAGTFSGNFCLSADMVRNSEALRQAVSETRALDRWLRAQGTPAVGLWGTSLGGWVAGLAATLDGDWDAVALWAPVASPQQVLWESKLVSEIRKAIRHAGMGPSEQRRWTVNLSPIEHGLLVERQRVLMVGGIYDSVVYPQSIAALARAWGVDVTWLPHGHISLMASFANTRDTAEFLARNLAPIL